MEPIHHPVKIHEVCKVTPPSESPKSTTELHLPITLFDIFWLKFPASKSIYFYKLRGTTPTSFNSLILPKLKHSLSLSLLHFLPLAGRLTWPPNAAKPIILYTPNDGVSLTIAESNADFDYLSGDEIRVAADLHHYAPELDSKDTEAPIVALQVTLFPDHGFCIGIATHHGFLDGQSVVLFLKAWSYMCKQVVKDEHPCLPPELVPFFDRSVIHVPEGIDMFFMDKLLGVGDENKSLKLPPAPIPPGAVRGTFIVSREDIKKLREKVVSQLDKVPKEDSNEATPLHLSTFVLTFAHILVCLAKAKGLENARQVIFIFPSDVRSRLDPPAPKNYIGNCIECFFLALKAEVLKDENGIAILAQRLSEEVKKLEKAFDYANLKEKIEFVTADRSASFGTSMTGSTRFGFYELDFGWGRPKKMEITSIDGHGSISYVESRDESGAAELGLVMNKQEMEIFSSLFLKDIKGI